MNRDVRRALVATFIARTAANGGLRVVYPFLPAIARGLGVSPAAFSSLIGLRNLGGFASPLVARASEKHGRKNVMFLAMVAVVLGCALTASTSMFVVAGVGVIMVGFAKPAFDISMQGWFGDRVPYKERGRIFGITELTWSVALLATVPLSGVLIERTSWRAPFVLVGIFAAIGTFAIDRGIEPDRPHEHVRKALRLTPERMLFLGSVLLFSIAAELPFIVYGQWLEGSFGLSVAAIGAFTLVVIAAEFIGGVLVTWFGDRLGLRAMLVGGLVVSAAAYASFSITGSALVAAIVVVAVWICAFEVTIIASIPFASELGADSRDRFLSRFAVMVATGRAIGAFIAQPLFSAGGIGLVGFVSAGCVVVAAVALRGVAERHDPPSDVSPSN